MTDEVVSAIQNGDVEIVGLTRRQAIDLIDQIDIRDSDSLVLALDKAQGDSINEGPQYVVLKIG